MAQYFIGRGNLRIYEDTAVAASSAFPPAVNQAATAGAATCADMRTMVDVERCSKVLVRIEMNHSAAGVATLNHPVTVYWGSNSTTEEPPYSGSGNVWIKEVVTTAMASYTTTDTESKWHSRHLAIFTKDAMLDTSAASDKTISAIKGSFMQLSVSNANTASTAHIRVFVERFY